MSVVAVGLNNRTVPLELLERMTVSEARLPKALADLASRDNVAEAIVVSTCMRTEIYAVAEKYHGAVQDIRNFLAELGGLPPEDFSDYMYSFHDEGAVGHLFRVACGLDSAVVGESEILGQVKDAWDRGREEGTAGPTLSALFRHAVEIGKKARATTGIARGITSVSQAAVAMAADRLGSLSGRRILVLGAGDMGEGMAVALAGAANAGEVLVANRTWSKATALAARIGGTAVEFGALGPALHQVDLLLTSTTSPSVLVEAADLAPVMAERPDRPLLIVDIAVPRDVDAAVGHLPGVTLLDMDDLRAFAAHGLESRRREIARVEELISEQVERHIVAAHARSVAPVVKALYDRAESVRQAEIERLRARLDHLDPRDREVVEALTRGIVATLLHEPVVRMKDAAGSARGDRLAEALRTLFDLDE